MKKYITNPLDCKHVIKHSVLIIKDSFQALILYVIYFGHFINKISYNICTTKLFCEAVKLNIV